MLGDLSKSMSQRYLPQFQQFNLTLTQQGEVLAGSAHSEAGKGSAWIMPINKHCMILEHSIVPAFDMQLLEITPRPYVCISKISDPIMDCMGEISIAHARFEKENDFCKNHATTSNMSFCTFTHNRCGEEYSPLKAGHLYYSRSVIIEPEYFDDLEQRYPGQFEGLFDSFSDIWNNQLCHSISSTLNSLTLKRLLYPGAHLYAQSAINMTLAHFVAYRQSVRRLEVHTNQKRQTHLANRARETAKSMLWQGEAPTIEALAAKLFVSRSTLCAAFKQETGESMGAFIRRIRADAAETLLLDPELGIAQIGDRLGYAQQSAFSQAFKRTHGISPLTWRKLHS